MKYSVQLTKYSELDWARIQQVCQNYGVGALIAKILVGRGFKDEEIGFFLKPSLSMLPHPDKMRGLIEAASLIIDNRSSHIAIAGDFDVDGLSSISTLASFFKAVEISYSFYVPDRFKEGYGLNCRMIDEALKQNAKLLICLDFGTSNGEQIAYAKEKGLKTIVVDHHHVYSHPGCDVFVNPMQPDCCFPYKNLCSAGLTWYLCATLGKQLKSDFDVRSLLDLATLGTICDMVQLTGINRIIATRGLTELTETPRMGIKAMREELGLKKGVTPYDVGFGFGPRINAAGRIKDGTVVVDLLTTDSWSNARKIAEELNRLNVHRQKTEQQMREEALKEVSEMMELPSGIVVGNASFHVGVIGIVASRLVESYYRPSVVLGMVDDYEDRDNRVFKGSVRGIPGFSVVAALDKLQGLLVSYGGHEAAGGLSILAENVERFKLAFNEECAAQLADMGFVKSVTVDSEVDFAELSLELWQELEKFEPTGIGNRKPTFYAENVKIEKVIPMKGGHYSLVLSQEERKIDAVWWKASAENLSPNTIVAIVFRIEVNDYRGVRSLRLNIQNLF